MSKCKECGSHAINPNHHGRNLDVMLDVCDVCYWRAIAYSLASTVQAWEESMTSHYCYVPTEDDVINNAVKEISNE